MSALASSKSGVALEHALGILHQFGEANPGFFDDSDAKTLVADVATEAFAAEGGSTMKSHYAYELAKDLDGVQALRILEARLLHDQTLPDPPEFELLERTAEEEPQETFDWAKRLLEQAVTGDEYQRWAIWTQHLHLSSLMGGIDVDATLAWFDDLEHSAQLRVMEHVNFALAEPDEFLRRLLNGLEDGELRREAARAYYNSLGTVTGPYHLGLERQRDRLKSWEEHLEGPGADLGRGRDCGVRATDP